MRNRPDAIELLELAERTLTDEVAADLSPRKRYTVALVGAALGIARRELTGGPSAFPGELDALQALCGADGEAEETPEDALDRLNRRFAADLRAGVYDPGAPGREAAVSLLREDVLARLAEDSPRYEK